MAKKEPTTGCGPENGDKGVRSPHVGPIAGRSSHRTVTVKSRQTLPRAPIRMLEKSSGDDTRYDELLHSVYDAVLITTMKGAVMEVNSRAQEFFQYELGELLELNILDIIHGADESLLGVVRQNVEQTRYTLLEAHCRRKDTSMFPAEIAINLIHLTPAGELLFFVRDITLRRQTEAMLQTEHNAVQNSANGIAIADPAGILMHVNPAFLALRGLTVSEDVVGHNIREFFQEGNQTSEMFAHLDRHEIWRGELVATRKNGTNCCVQVSAAPNRDGNGHSVGMVFSVADVTDRKQAAEALAKANRDLTKGEKIKSRLDTITTLSHEINNPLQMLLSMVELEGNQRYQAPLDRIIAVLAELRKQGELPTVSYAGGLERYAIAADTQLAASDTSRILVVDDEEMLREMFGETIRAELASLTIEFAADGKAAVESFKNGHHAVIIMDVVMPEMTGDQAFLAIEQFCRDEQWQMPAVIFCTAFTPPESVQDRVAEGSRHGYLSKPIGGKDLVAAVRERL